MSLHEECPYRDGRVVIGPAFKADAPPGTPGCASTARSTRPSSTWA
ncbi:hypothetical protein [Streptomyces humi]|nr:hypothetical protein [Streptomyces humi]